MTVSRRHALGIAAGAAIAAALWLRAGPLPSGLLDSPRRESTVVLDRAGEELYEARADDGSRGVRLIAGELPASLIAATIAAEDRRFWRHPGIDPVALTRATFRNLRRGHIVEGGSTLTQQVAKLLLARLDGSQPRGVRRKVREAIVALRLEHRLSKREILALYLNLAPYGNQLVGAERASQAYFGHGAHLLTPAQAAFLAALPQRPSWFNPYRDVARARLRQERVIVQMGLSGALTPDGVREALDERLSLQRPRSPFLAPHFVDRVLASTGSGRPRSLVTTLDASLQRAVQGIVHAERAVLDRIGAHNVAVAVLDNSTGEWLAWEGSGNYADAENGGAIDGVTVPRQPGSALKPFTYALAFEHGESPATVLPDVPSFFPTGQDGVLYSPRNYDNRFRGPLLARRALAGSENVPAVALASRVGLPNLLRFLRDAGFTTFDKTASYYGLGVTLGDAEVRLDELVAAYATLARGGVVVHPRLVRTIDGGAAASSDAASHEQRLVSPRTAFWISDILSDDDARAYAFGRGGSLEFPFSVAAKTGTSEGYHDNWAIGYTRDVTVGVWVGNFDRRPLLYSSGVSGAGPIFHAVMMAAEQRARGTTDPGAPVASVEGVNTVRRRVCALSGLTATPLCPVQIDEWVGTDTPPQECTWHRVTPHGLVVDWPEQYLAWARTERLVDRIETAPKGATPAPLAPTPLRISSPPDGAIYLIDPTLRREFQTLPLRAVGGGPAAVEWRVDGQPVGQGDAAATLDWPMVPGHHVITVTDRDGARAGVSVVVK